MSNILEINREIVINDYNSARAKNHELFLNGDVKTGPEYIYSNQKEDALTIVNKFHDTNIRAISIVKRTKVGMDGLMIELAKNMSTHPDDNFVIHRKNIFFITAMNNVLWEEDMKEKIPNCFKDNVYHHGKLQRLISKLKNIKNALIINDEIDSGDKEDQKLHLILKLSGILNIDYMENNNIRFVFVSATMINELRDLYKWGDKHYSHYMSIPESYIGHKEFLELGIIQEYYPIKTNESAEKWVHEDIIQNYATDYRVHLIRTDEKNKDFILNACIRNNILFKNHTSTDRISFEELTQIFDNITNHVVIAVKGFYRRANLIPNDWKKKIGATHERHVITYDANVQVQGLPGRMTGYWKEDILHGHKTGPHRTSIDAMNEYEQFYQDPFGSSIKPHSSSKLRITDPKMLNIESNDEPPDVVDIRTYRIYSNEDTVKAVCKILGYSYRATSDCKAEGPTKGFKLTSLNKKKGIASLECAVKKVPTAYGTNDGVITYRTYYPCYVDPLDHDTLRYVIMIRPTEVDSPKMTVVDTKHPSMSFVILPAV
jgi:hypothetical protein